MKKSVWHESVKLPEFESLKEDINTDVAIIGGGLCGILCAYFLDKAGVKNVLLEGGKIASLTSGNTTAKITFQHGIIYSKIIKEYGREKAKMYLEANRAAFFEYEKLCRNIDCDYERKDSYVYTLRDRIKIEKETDAVNSLGFKAEFEEKIKLPLKTEGAIKFKDQAQFNPLKFIAQIAKDRNIYENTFIREIAPGFIKTHDAKVRAKKIIVATHFPFINKHGNYFLKLYQHRSYVAAYKNAFDAYGMYVDENKEGMSFRNYKNFLFVGGGGHRTGKEGAAWREIRRFMIRNYPLSELKYEWAAQDCMSLDSIPYIGNYSKNTPDMYVATGFNKWGMTSSMAAAMILCDMITGKQNEYSEVFLPDRSILKPQLFINGFEAAANLIKPTKKRCPHLGCALKWNKYEHSWDCPCHGSRFEENGKLIENPATGDIKKSE